MLIGQFSYGSCRHPGPFDSGQGWKVVEAVATEGQTLPEDLTLTAAKPAGDFSPPIAPEFASREQMMELPSSLRLDPVRGSISCLLKSVAAGADYTRRSSIFSHGVIVDQLLIDDNGPVRPAELWDWSWLHPIGGTEIEDATLDRTVTTCARAALTVDTVLPFAEAYPRVFRPLLAGLESAIRDEKTLVLIEDDPAVASCWFAALQYFLPAAAAWSLPFNTWRRASDLLRRPAAGPYLVAVPSEDTVAIEALSARGAMVVSAGEPPREERTSDGEIFWRLSDSRLVANTWSRLAFDVMALDPWSRNAVWTAMDELAGSAQAGGRTAPLWFLAASGLKGAPDVGLGHSAALLAVEWPTTEGLSAELVLPLVERAIAAVDDRYWFFNEIAKRLPRPGEAAYDAALVDRVLVGLLKAAMTDSARPEALSWPPSLIGSESAMAGLLNEVPAQLAWTRHAPRGTVSAARAAIVAGWVVDSTWPGDDMARLTAEEAANKHLLPLLITDDARLEMFAQLGFPNLPESLWRNGVARFLKSVLGPPMNSVPAEFAELEEEIRGRWALPRASRISPVMRQWLGRRLDDLLRDLPGPRPSPAVKRSAWDSAISAAHASAQEPQSAGGSSADPTAHSPVQKPFVPAHLDIVGNSFLVDSSLPGEVTDGRSRSELPASASAALSIADPPSSEISSALFRKYASLMRSATGEVPVGWAADQVAHLWRDKPDELADLTERILETTPETLHDCRLLDLLLAETYLGNARHLVAAYRGLDTSPILELHMQFQDHDLLDAIRGRQVTNELVKRIALCTRLAQRVVLSRRTRFIVSCQERLAALMLLMDPAMDTLGGDLSRVTSDAGLRLEVNFYGLPFDEVWKRFSSDFKNSLRTWETPIDYYKILALLYVRTYLNVPHDPASEWLQGTSIPMAIPFSQRLVTLLSWAPADNKFLEEVRLQATVATRIQEFTANPGRPKSLAACIEGATMLAANARELARRR